MDSELLPVFRGQACFEHRDFPLPKHSWARQAAIAAKYFETLEPALGVEFRRHTLENFKQIPADGLPGHAAAFARRHGLDEARAAAALTDPVLAAAVEKDRQEGAASGVSRTPTVFVNGEPFVEVFTLEAISASIAAAVKGGAQ